MINVREGIDTTYCWISVWLVVDGLFENYEKNAELIYKPFIEYGILFTILIKVASAVSFSY